VTYFCLSTSFETIQLLVFTMLLCLCRYNLFLFAFIYMVPLAGMSYCYYRKGLPYTVDVRILRTDRWKIREHSWKKRNAGMQDRRLSIGQCGIHSEAPLLNASAAIPDPSPTDMYTERFTLLYFFINFIIKKVAGDPFLSFLSLFMFQ